MLLFISIFLIIWELNQLLILDLEKNAFIRDSMNMSTLSKMGLNSGNELQLATKTLLVTANVGSIFENVS
jgi:hypothetical protein